jgi:para-aminobenzoate synthetase/4-amino-4-deoxychorismate lyase
VLTHTPLDFSLLESLRWTSRDGYFLIDRHLDRLRDSAEYFSFPLDLPSVRQRLEDFAASLPAGRHKVRLLVGRDGDVHVESEPLAARPLPLRVCLAEAPLDSRDVFLYHKTTNRRVYEDAKKRHPEQDDVILWNERGEITESCTANVIVTLDGQEWTPPVRSGLLPGVYRALLLDQGRVRERVVAREDLRRCTALRLVNSVRGSLEAVLAS